jgi:hypothetical protein
MLHMGRMGRRVGPAILDCPSHSSGLGAHARLDAVPPQLLAKRMVAGAEAFGKRIGIRTRKVSVHNRSTQDVPLGGGSHETALDD